MLAVDSGHRINGESVDEVEHGRGVEPDIVRVEPHLRDGAHGVPAHDVLRQHHTLGLTRGAGGEVQHVGVVAREGVARRGSAVQRR